MAYERIVWANEETPLNAENLNRMEDGIEAAQIDSEVTTLFESLGWEPPTT